MTTPLGDPLDDPFHGARHAAGTRVDEDTVAALQVMHTLSGQLATAVTMVGADRSQRDNLLTLLEKLASGAVGEAGAHGYTWDSLLVDHHWRMTHLYAAIALDYAWAASRVATKLTTEPGPVTPLHQWSENERHPGTEWLTVEPWRRMFPVRMPAVDKTLGPHYVRQVTDLDRLLTDAHQRMHDQVLRVLKAYPDDMRSGGSADDEPRLTQSDRTEYEPRRTRLHDAASALHVYAAACARAVVLINITSAIGGHDG